MLDMTTDGRLQVTAAASLLDASRLVEWDSILREFTPVSREIFEYTWHHDVDPNFGRLICWIMFSSGAEFLAKGVCLLRGVDIRREQEVPVHPRTDLAEWARSFVKGWKACGTAKATDFGTLRHLLDPRSGRGDDPALLTLCRVVNATRDQEVTLLATYEFLRRTIRNRDAHAYVPNVRDYHYSLVPELFAGCFNMLVSWIPGGSSSLAEWRKEAQQFIAGL